MADAAGLSTAGDQGAKEERLHALQPAGDVEMDDLSKTNPNDDSAITTTSITTTPPSDDAARRPIPVPDKDPPTTTAAGPSFKALGKAPATTGGDGEDMSIDPVVGGAAADDNNDDGAALAVDIMLMLTSGTRHPFRIDERYLTRRNVAVTGRTTVTVDGSDRDQADPFSITVYTLKELILRDWRREWEDPPREPSSIRLIYFGKLLEDRNQLSHYNFSRTSRNVVHMTIKPQDLVDEEEAAKQVKHSGSHGSRGGCCVIL
ncbi:ubiquitin-related domain-containing protein [Xylariaceae sp. FL0804]|nr:ubiquitin-related domain-containing protein [Xylariaceae sp. FL0804]